MAAVSSYQAKQFLDWAMGNASHLAPVVCDREVHVTPPKPDPILDMKVGVAEAAVVGGAVLLGQNPKMTRRFWSRW